MYRLDEIVTGKHDKSKERFACLETVLTEANEKAEHYIQNIDEYNDSAYEAFCEAYFESWF